MTTELVGGSTSQNFEDSKETVEKEGMGLYNQDERFKNNVSKGIKIRVVMIGSGVR